MKKFLRIALALGVALNLGLAFTASGVSADEEDRDCIWSGSCPGPVIQVECIEYFTNTCTTGFDCWDQACNPE